MSKKILWLIPMMLLVALFSIGKLVSAEVVSSLPTAQKGNATTVKTPSVVASSTDFIWPTTVTHLVRGIQPGHTGLDITSNSGRATTFGQPTFAAKDGVVTFAGWNSGGYGNLIRIDHGGGIETYYAHHSQIFVSVGEHVTRGQTIGAIGDTGRSTGSLLHFEIRYNKKILNPLNYVKPPTSDPVK